MWWGTVDVTSGENFNVRWPAYACLAPSTNITVDSDSRSNITDSATLPGAAPYKQLKAIINPVSKRFWWTYL